ncbi:phospholipid-transporting ATPase IK-like isoform X2 [Ambystoma mexicanum]|uniref:phospholipid-transporting ATPase IK-like isoform X2 n=1 Tax=Ambystoma mexicanum TaxID=8296 RepID=UPI0037E73ED8
MSDEDPSPKREGGKKKVPDFTWEVRSNGSIYDKSVKKRSFLCIKRQKYAGNSITTSKYNVLTFIPLNLFQQFQHVHILYFTFMLIIQCIPAISTAPWYGATIPLSVLFLLRALKDLSEDIARHKSDKVVNNRPCEILRDSRFCQMKWKHIQVGDIVCLKKDDLVPADLLLLQSSEPNSLCYLETSGIDGETNLKFRQAPMVTHVALSPPAEELTRFNGKVLCEPPNSHMHTFIGTLEWRGEKYPLDNEKMLLRGCRIRNTDTCFGLVVYAGVDTKIMKNSGKVKTKKTKLDLMMNKIIFSFFLMLITAAACLAAGAAVWQQTIQAKHYYITKMPPQISSSLYGFFLFWGFIILLSTLVPMILYITMESIYLVHSLYINWDLEMYYAETDTPAAARSTTLNDNLGQIEYIFSDKTGTLTQNIMTFKKCCINGHIYGAGSDAEANNQEVNFCWNPYADKKFQFHDQVLVDVVRSGEGREAGEFFRLLALCHTVMVEKKEGDLVYQAASPDEEALVTASRNLGYVFLGRTQDTITVSELGVQRTYDLLALMDFTSVRKRMSVLVRDPEGKIMLYMKGADDVIFPRLDPDSAKNEVTEKALDLLGVTAIEDKLQEGVPATIQLLQKADIKIWVLTGDKQETAVNIGFSCRLLSEGMDILDEKEVCDILEANLKSISRGKKDVLEIKQKERIRQRALVITGEFLSKILSTDDRKVRKSYIAKKLEALWCRKEREKDNEKTMLERAFVDLASRCQAVICCRVTPKQKAIVVEMVKKHKKATTLAIGDGGNDVNMIKTAHIGVGISGQEGLQAVIASDYALAQFCYLQRLLLVHGRWSYFRISKFLRYYFYKTFAYMLLTIWFSFYNAFSAQVIFEVWFMAFHPLAYTIFPPICMGMLDKDVDAQTSLRFPELYRVGQTESLFNYRICLKSISYGIYNSLVNFFIPMWAFMDHAGPEGICDLQAFSITSSTAVVFAATIQAAMEFSQWTVTSALSVVISVVLFFIITFLTQLPSANPVMFTMEDAGRNAFSKLYIWLVIILSTAVCVIPSMTVRCLERVTSRSIISKAEDRPCGEVAMEDSTVELESYERNAWMRRASNAFSHDEGYGDLITRGISICKRRKEGPVSEEGKQTQL